MTPSAQVGQIVSSASCRDDPCGCSAASPPANALAGFSSVLLTAFGLTLVAVVGLVIVAEWLGLLERLSKFIPWPVWLAAIVAGGYPIFRNVARATLGGKVTSHTLMTAGLVAAILTGAWPAGIIIVFFMRLADYIEQFTAEHARKAVRDLTALAPATARVVRDNRERDVPVADVRAGETVVVRPGEKIPVDGEVIGGQATINQATITGNRCRSRQGRARASSRQASPSLVICSYA